MPKKDSSCFGLREKNWGKILSADDIATHFFAGLFMAPWGSVMMVEEGDCIVMPFPSGGELYRVEKTAFAYTYGVDAGVPSEATARVHWEAVLRKQRNVFVKTASAHAKEALGAGKIGTVVNGKV